MQFTTVDRVLAKFHRDFRGTDINESDAIEWIGEALGFLKVEQIQEEAVAFLEVENYETNVPAYFNMVIQIAKKRHWIRDNSCDLIQEVNECRCKNHNSPDCKCRDKNCTWTDDGCKIPPCGGCICQDKTAVYTDCMGNIIGPFEQAFYRPRFDLQWEYNIWRNSEFFNRDFIPVKLSDHTFFNSIVCKESNKDLYKYIPNQEEYTIAGTINKKLRFSFKEGLIALAYLRTAIDKETGYPLIPDNESYMAAITYYIKWKIAEWYQWNGREGFQQLPADLERKWLKYARQAKNYAKMPKNLDEYQNLMEQTYALPNLYRYKNFFGNFNYTFGRRSIVWLR